MFGRQVNGLPALVKKGLVKPFPTKIKFSNKSVIEFVLDLRERFRFYSMSANKCVENAKLKSKVWYNKKAKMISFKPGDEVLALLPYRSNSLQAKFFGPYKVLKKLFPVDYRIHTPIRKRIERICHVNLLKTYFRRDKEQFPHSDDSNEKTLKAQPVLVAFCIIHDSDDFGFTII